MSQRLLRLLWPHSSSALAVTPSVTPTESANWNAQTLAQIDQQQQLIA
jgi:hypothetical protein